MTMSDPVDAEQQRVERVLEAGLERVQTPEAARKRHRSRRATQSRQDGGADRPARRAPERPTQKQTRSAPPPRRSSALPSDPPPSPPSPPRWPRPPPRASRRRPPRRRWSRPRRPRSPRTLRSRPRPSAVDNCSKKPRCVGWTRSRRSTRRLYLAINEAPHPGWLDSVAWLIAIVTVGGWVWVIGALFAYSAAHSALVGRRRDAAAERGRRDLAGRVPDQGLLPSSATIRRDRARAGHWQETR